MGLADFILGKPISTWKERGEKIGPASAVPIFGLDALGSAAYGPEAALTILIPLGLASSLYIVPITACVIALLAFVYFSYRQTIAAYPGGGGSYTVATANLGTFPGLLAGTALLIDYILTAAVGISAGVGALVSALPRLLPHTLGICLAILLIITLVNLRGVRDTGITFMIPTCLFVGTLLGTIAFGLIKTLASGGHPSPVVAPPPPHASATVVTLWLLIQGYANGCTALTGVEAVSNGVRVFREPVVRNAERTLTVIIGILVLMLAGVALLVRAYRITATPPGEPGYQSVLSIMIAAVAGRGAFYYITVASILVVLALQANTAFADFPRVCRAIAEDSFLPRSFANRGRRLVYSQGIIVLALLVAVLLLVFRGVTDRLIPLFAIGAFLAFTMSQAGMVAHWKRTGGRGARHFMIVNALGALATGITLLIVLVAKFTSGAWITALVIPGLFWMMISVRRHYDRVCLETESSSPIKIAAKEPPLVVVPIESWNKACEEALSFALTLSTDVEGVHVAADEARVALQEEWKKFVEAPAKRAGVTPPKLVVIQSPYRFVLSPIVSHIQDLQRSNPGRRLVVLVPEIVDRHWYHHLLLDNRAELLKAVLLVKGSENIAITTVPWYLTV
jgi:amino acid transporter